MAAGGDQAAAWLDRALHAALVEPGRQGAAAGLSMRAVGRSPRSPHSPSPHSPSPHSPRLGDDDDASRSSDVAEGDGADDLNDGDGDGDTLDDSILPTSTTDEADNIRVFVRVRPASARESSQTSREAVVRVDVAASAVHLLGQPPRSFSFDGVLGDTSSQEDVFHFVGAGAGEACLTGYNGSIYVYGQTGSGKTHTMQGPVLSVEAMRTDERRGLLCRTLALIFDEIGRRHQETGSVQYTCKCSYLEIYREQITDLLESASTNLLVREDVSKGVYVERLSEHSVWTLSDALYVLWKGLHQRHVGATQLNELSSRSHAVFTLALEATSTTTGGVTSTRVARLNLIDLAGSERQSFDPSNTAAHESLRVKEAGAINRSLSALTNVIMSLSQAGQRRRTSVSGGSPGGGQPRRPFVRYRDSKLTFLLRDSLGGNSKTVIVACVSPSALCFGETLSTLKFAARAKHIRCAAVQNEEYSGTVESLMLEVKSLKQQLELLSSRGLLPEGTSSGSVSRDASLASIGLGSAAHRGGEGATREGEAPEEILAGHLEQSGSSAEELRRLYGPRRVRRLEILLVSALERERRSELMRHKLDKFTQYLNGLLERREQYFDASCDYFAFLVNSAADESCFMPEVTARLIMFRQQLSTVSSDSTKVTLDMFNGGPSSPDGSGLSGRRVSASVGSLGDSSATDMSVDASPESGQASRSRSSGILSGYAASRRRSRESCQSLQLHSSFGRLSRGVVGTGESPGTHSASSARLASPDDSWFPEDAAGFLDDDLGVLRTENRLLRRQLESHPDLFRLAAENRFLREHLASVVKQQALVRGEPPGPKGHKHQRRANDGFSTPKREAPKMNRERSLMRTSGKDIIGREGDQVSPRRSEADGASGSILGLGRFPGIEDATQISPSSSSAESDNADDSHQGALRGGVDATWHGNKDATAFLQMMSREVEELLRIKTDLEDDLKQLPRVVQPSGAGSVASSRANGATREDSGHVAAATPAMQGLGNSSSDSYVRAAKDILQSATDALKFAEGMLAKGKGDTFLLSAGGAAGQDLDGDDDSLNNNLRARSSDGLDERDVFMSLMRSLPSEKPPSLFRNGFASSAPHLLKSMSKRGGPLQGGVNSLLLGGGGMGSSIPTLRTSCSAGSAVGRMMRQRSTMQLHRIAEQSPASPLMNYRDVSEVDSEVRADSDVPSQRDVLLSGLKSSGDMLQDSVQKIRQLCNQLERVSDTHRDMRSQFVPLQDEYHRRLDECRFLESQCRRLDLHCRLLEERAITLGDGGAPSRSSFASGLGPGWSSGLRGGAIGGCGGGGVSFSTERHAGNNQGVVPPIVGMSFVSGSQSSTSPMQPQNGHWQSGASRSHRHSAAGAVGGAGGAVGRSPSTASLGRSSTASLGRSPSAAALQSHPEVPPRGLLYAASVQELRLNTGMPPTGGYGRAPSGQPYRMTGEEMRRVFSAPQLHAALLQPERSATFYMGRSASGDYGLSAGLPCSSANLADANASQHHGGYGIVGPGGGMEAEGCGGGMSASVGAGSDHAYMFLSLARQSGGKTAALQYLMSSPGQALGGGASNAVAYTLATHRPSRSSSVGVPPAAASLGSVGGGSGLGFSYAVPPGGGAAMDKVPPGTPPAASWRPRPASAAPPQGRWTLQ